MRRVLDWIRSRWSRWRASPPSPEAHLGPWGERLAAEWLEGQGLHICGRRVRTPYGEIDLIARDGDTLVFIEVKTRWGDGAADLWEVLRPAQRKRIERSARYYIAHIRARAQRCRFDLIVVGLSPQGRPAIRWVWNAWSEEEP